MKMTYADRIACVLILWCKPSEKQLFDPRNLYVDICYPLKHSLSLQ
jgi:hypothetical protein